MNDIRIIINFESILINQSNLEYIDIKYCYDLIFFLIGHFVFSSSLYRLACKEGYFGTNCLGKCSPNCKPDTCRHTDGSCSCDAGWMGDNCTQGNCFFDYSIVYTLE